jgi:hypothetical protein
MMRVYRGGVEFDCNYGVVYYDGGKDLNEPHLIQKEQQD